MPKTTERELLARDAKRDLNAELLQAVRDIKAWRIGRVWQVAADGAVKEVLGSRARKAAALPGVSMRDLEQFEQGRRARR